MSQTPTINDVRNFWENTPLFVGESQFPKGSAQFFEEHARIINSDCFPGRINEKIFPARSNLTVLDLGCGPGFWTIELAKRGHKTFSGDLTTQATELTATRCKHYGLHSEISQQNAEALTYADASFDHVNCLGVIHHTPKTAECVGEIARVIRSGGTACIAVYYKNVIIKAWPIFVKLGAFFSRLGFGLKGRGREKMFESSSVDEIVRKYDGETNPIGKAYSKAEFIEMLAPHFEIDELYLHFFPKRALPFAIPAWLHRFLDRNLGFMIYANLRKKN
jgi:2-polyprenyl-3-methyl-5-hydroxy-6-metoxy-1,4-benzoquinol methylase